MRYSIIKRDEEILNKYNEIQDKISKLECETLSYKQELVLLETKEEYKYNRNCEYCCKRPWVNRINELNIIISKYDNDIKTINVMEYLRNEDILKFNKFPD